MEAREIENVHEPYVRGPHIKYFLTALMIAFMTVIALMIGSAWLVSRAY